jgi:hypothetical protein
MKRLIISIILNVLCLSSYCFSWEGIGTEDQPYLISTSQHLVELAEEVNNGTDFHDELFSLINDIDLSDVCGESIGNWTPIGSITNYFEGILLGNNHTISNLYFNVKGNGTYCGLFGHVGERGAIHDLTIKNGFAYSVFWCGGIVASNSGLISNCKNINCNVDSWHFSGGICGVNFNTITNCSNQAEVNSSLCSGGICAYNYGTITNCINKNSITANESCGGICGYNGGFANIDNCYNVRIGFIDNCRNNSSIMGNGKIGGIAGRNDGFIVNAMNNGEINGGQQVGGIAGTNGGFDGVIGNISNSFNIGNVIGRDTLTGGIVGYGNHASEIYNVYTVNNVYCLNSSTSKYIGEEIGQKDNCFIIIQPDNSEILYSIADQLNQWIDMQSDPDSYLKWKVMDNYIYTINENSLSSLKDSISSPISQDDIKTYSVNGHLYLISPTRQSVGVYSVDGKAIRKIDLLSNALTRIQVGKGVYIVNGQKVIVY